MGKVRVVHYLNQFFAGIGGEEKADIGASSAEKPIGPAIGLAQVIGDAGEIVATVWCGDNYMASNGPVAVDQVVNLIGEFHPDVVVAGPSFASGRYGLACAEVCVAVQDRLHIPAVAAMHQDAPAAEEFRRSVIIVPSAETAVGMGKVLPVLARLALKLGQRRTSRTALPKRATCRRESAGTSSPRSGGRRGRSQWSRNGLPEPTSRRNCPCRSTDGSRAPAALMT